MTSLLNAKFKSLSLGFKPYASTPSSNIWVHRVSLSSTYHVQLMVKNTTGGVGEGRGKE